MARTHDSVLPMGVCALLSIASVPACVSYEDLGPSLDAVVGRKLSEVTYPPTDRLVRSTDRGAIRTLEYEFSGAGNCRWQFDAAASGEIVAWRYPDAKAASYCRALASTRP